MTRRAWIALVVALAAQPGCGIPQRAARSAAESAVGTLARKVSDAEGVLGMGVEIKRRAAGVVVDELSQPERLVDLQRIASAVATGTVSGASKAASGALSAFAGTGERAGRETRGETPVETIASLVARAFSRQLVADLGRAGDGPLATSLSAATEQVAGSIARGARGELAPLFPECQGADTSKCLDRAVERLSRATSAGVAAGIRESLGVWPLAVAFGVGALSALALGWARGTYRTRRPAPPS